MNNNVIKLIVFGVIGAVAGNLLFGYLNATGHGALGGLLILLLLGGVGFVIIKNLSSNRKIAKADPGARQAALSFVPPAPGACAIYVIREGFVGMAVGITVELDGRNVTQLKSPRFTRMDMAAGHHTIRALFGASGSNPPPVLELNLASGEIAAVRLSIETGMIGSKVLAQRVDVATIRDKLAKIDMVALEAA